MKSVYQQNTGANGDNLQVSEALTGYSARP